MSVYDNAKLIDITTDDHLVFEYQGESRTLRTFSGSARRGDRGEFVSLRAMSGDVGRVSLANQGGEDLYRFDRYADQTLRRAYELDLPSVMGERRNGAYIAWRSAHAPDGFHTPASILPGQSGAYVPDETEPVVIDVPPEFTELCAQFDATPEEVLRGFIADAAELHNYVANPRADGYSSNGSDERGIANDYLQRAHGHRLATTAFSR